MYGARGLGILDLHEGALVLKQNVEKLLLILEVSYDIFFSEGSILSLAEAASVTRAP